jgi:SAM-dependent methyltransferase
MMSDALARFVREYRTVRRAEGWGSLDGSYYRALPYRDLTGRFRGIWRMRARSYEVLVKRVVEPLEGQQARPLTVLDLGAGNAWLAYRLGLRGHRMVAIDLLEDALDGLGATRHYDPIGIMPLRAAYDQLPLAAEYADLAVFNASFHYSTDYAATLREALRVLRARGTLVILDSPMYLDPTSGARMVQERRARFLARYGFASDALPSEHFLTPARLDQLAVELGIRWRVHRPALAWRDALARTIGGLRARREPARLPVIVGERR